MSGFEPKPAFQVEKVTGKFTRMTTRFAEDIKVITNAAGVERKVITRRMVHEPEHFDEGYMVYMPQGHSIFVAVDDEEQINRLGLLGHPVIVDMNSGEVVPDDYNLSPKEIVDRKQRNRPRPATQGGLSDL